MALTDNLISYWKLDGDSTDSVDSINGSDTDIIYSAGNGKIVQGAGFNGTTSKIDLGAVNPLYANSATSFSLSFWVKINASTWGASYYELINDATDDPNGNNGFYISLDNRNNHVGGSPAKGIQFICKTATGNFYGAYSNDNVLSANGWHHVVCTYENGVGHIYVDNIEGTNVSESGSGNFIPRNAHLFFGATSTPDLFLNAALDEIGLWTRALTSTEVNQLWNGGAGLAYPLTTTVIYTMVTAPASFTYTPQSSGDPVTRYMTTAKATYVLTGMSAGFHKAYVMVTAPASYVLTGMSSVFTVIYKGWYNFTKHTSSWTNKSKNSSNWTNKSKSSNPSWTNKTKS